MICGRVMCFSNIEDIVDRKKMKEEYLNEKKTRVEQEAPCTLAALLDIVNLPYNPFCGHGGIYSRFIYIEHIDNCFFLSFLCSNE